jgi:hypothetical protein
MKMSIATRLNESLFSPERSATSRRDRWLESDYQRLDRKRGEIADRVRGLMDEWYARLPEHSRAEILQRFAEKSRGAHLGAFWEMYLHEAANRLGFDVDFDVGRNHADRRPDLLLRKGVDSFFIEATVILGDGAIPLNEQPRARQLYTAIERIRNRSFLLHTSLEKVGQQTPGRRIVTDPLDQWLDRLDPDIELARVAAGGAAQSKRIDKEGWRLRIDATAMKPDLRGESDMGVIGSLVEGFAEDPHDQDLMREIDDITPLTNGLLKKAGHGYEVGGRPFVIAVLCAGDFVDDQEIAQALLGPIEYRGSMSSNQAVGEYLPGGLWHEGAGARYTEVSAVLTASNLSPTGVAAVEPCLWLNPAATHPVDTTALPWRRYEIQSNGQMVEHPATVSAANMFGLPAGWPGVG